MSLSEETPEDYSCLFERLARLRQGKALIESPEKRFPFMAIETAEQKISRKRPALMETEEAAEDNQPIAEVEVQPEEATTEPKAKPKAKAAQKRPAAAVSSKKAAEEKKQTRQQKQNNAEEEDEKRKTKKEDKAAKPTSSGKTAAKEKPTKRQSKQSDAQEEDEKKKQLKQDKAVKPTPKPTPTPQPTRTPKTTPKSKSSVANKLEELADEVQVIDGEEEEEPGQPKGRDRLKSRWMRQHLGELPAWVQQSFGGKTTRKQQTELINQLVVKGPDGGYSFDFHAPALGQERKMYKDQEGVRRTKGVPRVLAVTQAGGETQFIEAVRCGDLMEVEDLFFVRCRNNQEKTKAQKTNFLTEE